jgi:hypothetical protein
MGRRVRRTRKPPVKFESTVIEVERQELSYALWQHEERSPVGPINRMLTLYGRVLIGEPKLRQLPAVVVLFGKDSDQVTSENARGVAVLRKTRDRADVTASVPIDFMATLSHAFHDGRISIVQGWGPRTVRNVAVWTSLTFGSRAEFERNQEEEMLAEAVSPSHS